MAKWMCAVCGYQLEAELSPERCPSCHSSCDFRDITCYTPECGTEGNIDLKLASTLRKEDLG